RQLRVRDHGRQWNSRVEPGDVRQFEGIRQHGASPKPVQHGCALEVPGRPAPEVLWREFDGDHHGPGDWPSVAGVFRVSRPQRTAISSLARTRPGALEFLFDSEAAGVEGKEIQDLGGGSFRTTAAVQRYSLLDQYAMGLIDKT